MIGQKGRRGTYWLLLALDDAIDAYTKGFISDPRDYYPGVNAVTLLIEKGDEESLKKAKEYAHLVSFSVARRGGASSSDYLDVATVLEMACINNDWNARNSYSSKGIESSYIKERILDAQIYDGEPDYVEKPSSKRVA